MNDKELKQLHNKILEIIEYFDKFCKDNGITYYLMGGSALGAMRHQGFIPWDDDFDVFMDYENYMRFLDIADKKLDKNRFYFQKENTKEWLLYFSKIRMNGTTFIEENLKDKQMHHGIYIDIMCLNGASSIKSIRYIQYLSARVLSAIALSHSSYKTNSLAKKVMLYLAKYIDNDIVKSNLLRFVRYFNNKEHTLVGHFFGRASFDKTSFDKSYLGKPRYVKFEKLMLPVPSEVEKYLTLRYGKEYMKLPSDEVKAQYPSHACIVDTQKSYKEYIVKEKNV
ncbi:MAG: LicD family protein [Campylobacterales bacterium]